MSNYRNCCRQCGTWLKHEKKGETGTGLCLRCKIAEHRLRYTVGQNQRFFRDLVQAMEDAGIHLSGKESTGGDRVVGYDAHPPCPSLRTPAAHDEFVIAVAASQSWVGGHSWCGEFRRRPAP